MGVGQRAIEAWEGRAGALTGFHEVGLTSTYLLYKLSQMAGALGHRLIATTVDTGVTALMAWDPAVLRKYNTTGHFRLLNQLRGELKDNPLVRPRRGETVGDANRSKALTRLLEGRQASGGRSRRVIQTPKPVDGLSDDQGGGEGFRDRLNAVELR